MSAPVTLPPVVEKARRLSHRLGFMRSCRNETGRLLATLAAATTGTLAETGTGSGIGAAWIRSGMRSGARLITVEHDAKLADAVREVFEGDAQVDVVQGDWTELTGAGPFSLLFLDVSEAKAAGPDTVADLMTPSGVVLLDDFTPYEGWPPMFGGRVDTVRQLWLTDPRFVTVEVMVASDSSVLIATRR